MRLESGVGAELLRDGIFYNRDKLYRRHGTRAALLTQHLAMAEAVLSGDAERAAHVADGHIRFTFNTIEEIRRGQERLDASLRRLVEKVGFQFLHAMFVKCVAVFSNVRLCHLPIF
jgi:hypothetical protein